MEIAHKRGIPVLAGGIMSSFAPDTLIKEESIDKTDPIDDDKFQTKDDLKSEITRHFEKVLNGIRIRGVEKTNNENTEPEN